MRTMKLYLAPMEGITGYIYRNAIHSVFGAVYDRCFSPFLSPRPRVGLQSKDRRDILPENNRGIRLIPQLLSKDAGEILSLSNELHELYGYEEFNINCGCPSKTVVSHGRGAGMLKDPDELDRFLDGLFSSSALRFSVKTRMGISDPEEFEALLKIYEKYPLTELIVHARVLNDYYRLPAKKEAFLRAVENTCLPIVYNGDIFSPEDLSVLTDPAKAHPSPVTGIMLGRGAITDPALGRRLREELSGSPSRSATSGGTSVRSGSGAAFTTLSADDRSVCSGSGPDPVRYGTRSEYRAFHDIIYSSYLEIFDGPTPLLFHMKELWSYMGALFPDRQKSLKRLRKAGDTAAYLSAVNEILQ